MKDLPAPVAAVVARLPRRARPGAELVARTINDSLDDRIPGLAAEIAFYLVLSLPPLLIAIVGLAGFVGQALEADVQQQALDLIRDASLAVFDRSTVDQDVVPLVERLLLEGNTRVLSFGFALTVFAASRALRALVRAITVAYDLEETRRGWQQFLRGIVLTLGGLVIGLPLIPLLVAGPNLGQRLVDWMGLPDGLAAAWPVAYWPGAFALLTVLIAGLYHAGAPWVTPFRRDLPGALLASSLGLLASVGLRWYSASAFGGASEYGPLAAPLALLLWLYAQGFSLLLGAELNAEIERMWPTDLPQQRPAEERVVRRIRAARDRVNGTAGDVVAAATADRDRAT